MCETLKELSMAKRNTIIQINGKRYDALSGTLLSFEETTVPAVKSIDGFVAGSRSNQAIKPVAKKPVATAAKAKPTAINNHHAKVATLAANPAAKHKVPVQRKTNHAKVVRTNASTTLMRHAVKKPQASLKSRTKVAHPVKHASRTVIIPKTSIRGVNHVRAARAAEHQLHPRVSHFAQEVSMAVATVKADVQETIKAIDNAIVIPQTYTPSGTYRPDIRRVKVKATPTKSTTDIFEQALLRATSHEESQPALPKGRLRSLRRRMVSFSAGAVAVLAIVGFFGFQKQDTIQFQVASSQVSFQTTMPGYQPQGFSVNNIRGTNNTLFVEYANADKSYTISQKPSNWDHRTLIDRIADNQGRTSYVVTKANDRTIYLYGRNQAAWIHNGVLYQVLGNGVLSSSDFSRIASSM
jgi:hypothetical protein